MRGRAVLMAGMTLVAGVARAGDRWFNLQVTDPGEPVEVSMQVPLPLVASVLDGVHSQRIRSRHMHLDWDFDSAGTRAMLARVRGVPDGKAARFVQDGTDVVVRRHDPTVLLEVTGKGRQAVEIELPTALLDALDIREDQLDLEPLVRHLETVVGDVLRVTSGSTRVHVWVEER